MADAPGSTTPQRTFTRTLYKRDLPAPATAFSSAAGKQIFAEALADGTAASFFHLIEVFSTQDEPAFCGLASLAMVLNSLAVDPRRPWKGPWRWFAESLLDCCVPLATVKNEGITLTQAACLARCNGAQVELYRHASLDDFRALVSDCCSCRSAHRHIVVSYSRKALNQTGDGHFSPIGAFAAEKDLVLVLDTARFKYPPHWLPLAALHAAMYNHTDPATKQPRGFLSVCAAPLLESVLFTLNRRRSSWRAAYEYLQQGAAEVVSRHAAGAQSAGELVRAVAASAPHPAWRQLLAERHATDYDGFCAANGTVETLLAELRLLPLYAALAELPTPSSTALSHEAVVGDNLRGTHDSHLSTLGSICSDTIDVKWHCECQPPTQTPGGVSSSGVAEYSRAFGGQLEHDALHTEALCMLVLMMPTDVWRSIQDTQVESEVGKILELQSSSVVHAELRYLQNQLQAIAELERGASEARECPACSVATCAQEDAL